VSEGQWLFQTVGFPPETLLVLVARLTSLSLGVAPEVAAIATDAVTTAYHAIHRRGEVKASETCFLFGLGGLGFNALQIVKEIGARVIVTDVKQERLDDAAALGIPSEDIVPLGKAIQDFVAENRLRIDTVLDFVGTHQTFEDAQQIGRIGLHKCSNCFQPTDCLFLLAQSDEEVNYSVLEASTPKTLYT
jgi:propanol-preferring alcohol dehydrogenase